MAVGVRRRTAKSRQWDCSRACKQTARPLLPRDHQEDLSTCRRDRKTHEI